MAYRHTASVETEEEIGAGLAYFGCLKAISQLADPAGGVDDQRDGNPGGVADATEASRSNVVTASQR